MRPAHNLLSEAGTGMGKDVETPELSLLSALELRRLIRSHELSPREAAAACLARIRAVDDRIGSFVTIDEEMVIAMADRVERRLKEGAALPLAGIPFALKDLTDTAGLLPHLESGALDPPIGSVYPLERATEALVELDERRAVGKVLLEIEQG